MTQPELVMPTVGAVPACPPKNRGHYHAGAKRTNGRRPKASALAKKPEGVSLS